MAEKLTESSVKYNDLISTEDQEFWSYLCKKDFRRLDKLMTQGIGDGYFIDDSDEYDSDDSDKAKKENQTESEDGEHNDLMQKRSKITSRQRRPLEESEGSSLAEENDEIDHLNFIEQMLMKNNRGSDNLS